MSDYLGSLIARTVAPAICVRPQMASIFEPAARNAEKSELNFEHKEFTEEKSLPRPKTEASPASNQSNIDRTVTHETEIVRREIIQPKIVTGQSEGKRADDTAVPVRSSPRSRHDESDSAQDGLPEERRVRSSRKAPDISVPSPLETVAQPSSTPHDRPVATSRRPESNAVEIDVDQIRREPRPLSAGATTESPILRLPVVPTQRAASKLPHLKPQRLPVIHAVVPSKRLLPEKPASTKPQQTISVTIGRIEIRAVSPPAQQRAKSKPPTVLSLEDYLRQRASGGSR